MVEVPETIVCVECRGTCHRLGHPPPEGYESGDWVAYRCGDCMDRFDLEVPDAEDLRAEAEAAGD